MATLLLIVAVTILAWAALEAQSLFTLGIAVGVGVTGAIIRVAERGRRDDGSAGTRAARSTGTTPPKDEAK